MMKEVLKQNLAFSGLVPALLLFLLWIAEYGFGMSNAALTFGVAVSLLLWAAIFCTDLAVDVLDSQPWNPPQTTRLAVTILIFFVGGALSVLLALMTPPEFDNRFCALSGLCGLQRSLKNNPDLIGARVILDGAPMVLALIWVLQGFTRTILLTLLSSIIGGGVLFLTSADIAGPPGVI